MMGNLKCARIQVSVIKLNCKNPVAIANCITSSSLNHCDLCSEYKGFSSALSICRTCAGNGFSTSYGDYSKCSITGAGVVPDACKEGYID